jgi:hypothetical protein
MFGGRYPNIDRWAMTAGRYEGATAEKAVPFLGRRPSILICDSSSFAFGAERLYMPLAGRRMAGRCSPKPNRRRALELLASCPEGCTEAILAARDIPVSLIVQLVRAGLATTKAERVVAGRLTIEVTRIWLTEAGRQALADKNDRRSMKVAE